MKGLLFLENKICKEGLLNSYLSSSPGEVDKDALSTLRHTFLDFLFFGCVVEGSYTWGSGAP